MEGRAPARGDLARAGLAALVLVVVQLDLGLSEPWTASTAARWVVGAALAAALLMQGAKPALGAGLLCVTVAVQVAVVDPSVTFGHFIAFFAAMTTVARRAALGPAVAALLAMAAAVVLVGVRAADPEFELAFPLFVFGCGWALGRVVRSHAAQSAALAELGRRLEIEQNRVREIAVMEERGRIAGDLHDVLAHSMTSIVVQAGAADEMLAEDPSAARDLLRRIEEAGRAGLVELRGLLRMLDDMSGSVSPPPVLDDLPELVRTVHAHGATVELRVDPGEQALAEGLQVATYRIVQEALTNVLRHAGAAPVRVVVERTARGLEVEVLNGTAPGSARPPALPGAGRGIAGMVARAAVYGGELTAGPTPEGGFEVKAVLPAGAA